MWRKPWWQKVKKIHYDNWYIFRHEEKNQEYHSKRELISIDSGFRQFIVNSNMIKTIHYDIWWTDYIDNKVIFRRSYDFSDHQFWIILSSLSEDVEQFIIDNIKLDG